MSTEPRNPLIDFNSAGIRVGLLCPGGDQATLSSLALHFIKRELDKVPGWFSEFLLNKRNYLYGEYTDKPLVKYDILAVTASWLGDYFRLKKILEKHQLSEHPGKRKNLKIIVGGPGVVLKPDVFLDIADGVFVGDADKIIAEIFDAFISGSDDIPWLMLNQNQTLPSPRKSMPDQGIALFSSAYAVYPKVRLVEVSRGCPFRCSFCWLSHSRRDFQTRSSIEVISETGNLKERIGLVSAAILSHPDINRILTSLTRIALPSCRYDLLNKDIIDQLSSKQVKSITLAPEVGNDKMSDIICKNFDLDKLLNVAELLDKAGFKKLKLYFMLGLPHEDIDDVQSIFQLLEKISQTSKMSITASFSQFIPMPGTPLENEKLQSKSTMVEKFNVIKNNLNSLDIKVNNNFSGLNFRVHELLNRN